MRHAAVCLALLALTATAEVTVDVSTDGRLSVRHAATGRVWRSAEVPEPPALAIVRLAAAPTIDGRGDDWPGEPTVRLTADMTTELKAVDGAADCSGELRLGWDEAALYACLRVRDERLVCPAAPTLTWWERDSAEIWLGATQIGFSVTPDGRAVASLVSRPADGCQVAFATTVARAGHLGPVYAATADGWTLEVAVPWSQARPALEPVIGARLPFAVGINDADATGEREGQLYWPATWVHSQPMTFAGAVLTGPDGRLPVDARRRTPRVTNIERSEHGLRFVAATPAGEPVRVTADEDGDAVVFTIDTPDHDAPLEQPLAYPPPLTSDLADGRLCFAPYGNGLLIPQTNERFRGYTYWGHSADLPFVGCSEGPTGDGYLVVLETPYDGGITLQQTDGKLTPRAVWQASLGRFAYARRVRYEFFAEGGYVAAAKRYRAIARRDGHLVTLREKKLTRPAVSRLAGAANVWGGGAAWAAEARRWGVQSAIVNGEDGAPGIEAINSLGYLSSRYDNYVDLLEENDPAKWDNNHGPLDHVARHRDGSPHMGWLTWDKATQYYQRRSDRMRPAAEAYISRDLAARPYLGRFLDVTTAMSLVESYHPEATYGHEQDMRQKLELFDYVNSRPLVTGGEHGRWWAVSKMDYFEGMMSFNPFFSWPAGHLLKPDNLEGISAEYREYGLGPVLRIPLWELVFHDCVVDYWYWGDTNGYLHEFDPSLSDRKDAFNVLYGTPPMYWATRLDFGWDDPAGRRRLLASYRHTGPWAGEVMFEEMLTHEALTEDRLVQRTTFAGGFEATVNFAGENRRVTVDGREVELPPHGFVARGPRYLAERRTVAGGVATRLKGRRYVAVDAGAAGGEPVSVPGLLTRGLCAMTIESPQRLRLAQGSDAATINPAALVDGWDAARMRLFELDAAGERVRAVPLDVRDGKFDVDPAGRWLELACGDEVALADLVVGPPSLDTAAPEQGQPVALTVDVTNEGWTPVVGGRVRLEIDGLPWAEEPLDLAAGERRAVGFVIDTATIDGPRTVTVVAETPAEQAEQLLANNRAELPVDIAIDWRRWPRLPAARFEVTNPVVLQRDAVVSCELTLPPGSDPASVRVLDAVTNEPAPCQFETTPADPLRGTLVWIVPGPFEVGARRSFDVIAIAGDSGLLKPSGGFWRGETSRIETPVYGLDLGDGVPTALRVKVGEEPDRPVISQLVYSCAETGWVTENGVLERIDVLAQGPVRTVVRVERRLADGLVRYARTFAFLADRFEVETRARPSVTGLHHRLYLAREGTYADSLGRVAAIDGEGDAEDISGGTPAWVAIYGPQWSLSLVRLAGGNGLAYWDAGNMGGLGYQGDPELSRDVLAFREPAAGPAFAAADAARWHNPLTVQAVPVR